jgi:thioredoxin reductase
MENKRIAVIGGGWSGLYALKYFLEEKVDCRLYECQSNIGGIWLFKQEQGGVYQSTHVTSSKIYLHASDFSLSDQTPNFPKHDQILAHLNSYADHFNLWPHINFQCSVIKIEQYENNQWKVIFIHNGIEIKEIFDALIIATGQHQTANDLRHIEPFNRFTGTVSHSISYKKPDEENHRNKTILIVGGGETASDLAVELCGFARCIYMSIRGGQWFQERLVGDQPADILFTKSLSLFGFYDNIWVKIGWKLFIRPFWGEGGTGIIQWKPRCQLFHGLLNKSRDVVNKVALGMVKPKRIIKNINKNLVTFDDDDESVHIDHILFCTGYKWSHPFIDNKLEKEVILSIDLDLILFI